MPINIPMMSGRSNPLIAAGGGDNVELDFVPPHILEQQKVSVTAFQGSASIHPTHCLASLSCFVPHV